MCIINKENIIAKMNEELFVPTVDHIATNKENRCKKHILYAVWKAKDKESRCKNTFVVHFGKQQKQIKPL